MASKAIIRYRSRSKARHRARGKITLPLAALAGFVPLTVFALEGYKVGGIPNAGRRIAQRLTGYDSTANVFISKELMAGWGPILTGMAVHWLAGKVGINRALGRAHVPLLRL
jgi:hypothetical protein